MAKRPIAAVVARLEPDAAANPADEKFDTTANPPGSLLNCSHVV